MNLFCLGLDYQGASLELRERLAFTGNAIDDALDGFIIERHRLGEPREEVVILSTCNRVEVYGYLAIGSYEDRRPSLDRLIRILGDDRGIAGASFSTNCYRLTGISVAEHLGRVASGLDSMILGEPQILGQVSRARRIAVRAGSAGPVLTALFDYAIRAGRRARHETAINRKPATVGSVAATLARKILGEKRSRKVAIIGAGGVARSLVQQLSGADCDEIAIVNRTLDSAVQLADQWGATAYPLEQLAAVLSRVDVAIASTSAPRPVVSAEMVRFALGDGCDRSLTVIDLAVPRDVEPEVRSIERVRFYDLDDLRSQAGAVAEERSGAIPLVEQIIREEVEGFQQWLGGLSVARLITGLRRKAEAIRKRELDRALSRLPEIDAETKQQFEHLSRTLVNRILHDPTTRLRIAAGRGTVSEKAETVRHLFNLRSDLPSDQTSYVEKLP